MTTRIHLIRTEGVEDELFAGVVSLLQAIPGPIQVVGVADYPRPQHHILNSLDEHMRHERIEWDRARKIPRRIMSGKFTAPHDAMHWSHFYRKADEYRRDEDVPTEDMVIVLSELSNHRNWFSALDMAKPTNGFIHTADWEMFLHAPAMFPVAYEVIALLLQRPIYANEDLFKRLVHDEPRGCIDDFCQDKKQIFLKLRTADICQDCMDEFQKHHPIPVIDHALAIMESLREKMLYAQNFRQNSPPSPLLITRDKRIFLPEYANMEIPLTPLEKTLFLFFLNHPEGVLLTDLCDHREELYAIYASLATNGGRVQLKRSIDGMTNALSNSASEKMSKIKRAFETNAGKTLARHYYIQGEMGEKRGIPLDRGLVIRA